MPAWTLPTCEWTVPMPPFPVTRSSAKTERMMAPPPNMGFALICMRMDWEPLLRNLVTWRGRFGLHHDSRRDGARGQELEVTGILVRKMDEWRKTQK